MALSLGLSITLFFLTALLTWGWIKIAQTKKIYDVPGRRRLHQTQVPRAGGISIAIVMIFVSISVLSHYSTPQLHGLLIISALILYSALGFWDDFESLGSRNKLLFHFLISALLFLSALFGLAINAVPALLIATAYLLFVNIWNFMDGSNGMISLQSLIMSIGIFILSDSNSTTHLYAIALAVSCCGFLPFNFPTAKVFLGDVGSHALGAAAVGLGILAYSENQWTVLEMLCLSSALWVDAVLTFVRRFFRGFKVTQAHRSHLYQYLIRAGNSHTAIGIYYAAWTSAVVLVIGLGRQLPELSQPIVLFAVITTACALHQWLRLFVLKSRHSQKKSKNLF